MTTPSTLAAELRAEAAELAVDPDHTDACVAQEKLAIADRLDALAREESPAWVGEGFADFEIHAGGEYYASTGGPREIAWREAMVYVSTLTPYDGEPEVFEVTRKKIDLPPPPTGDA